MNAFSAPGITHARHAPNPQPIAASVENSAGTPRASATGASAANIPIGPQA